MARQALMRNAGGGTPRGFGAGQTVVPGCVLGTRADVDSSLLAGQAEPCPCSWSPHPQCNYRTKVTGRCSECTIGVSPLQWWRLPARPQVKGEALAGSRWSAHHCCLKSGPFGSQLLPRSVKPAVLHPDRRAARPQPLRRSLQARRLVPFPEVEAQRAQRGVRGRPPPQPVPLGVAKIPAPRCTTVRVHIPERRQGPRERRQRRRGEADRGAPAAPDPEVTTSAGSASVDDPAIPGM